MTMYRAWLLTLMFYILLPIQSIWAQEDTEVRPAIGLCHYQLHTGHVVNNFVYQDSFPERDVAFIHQLSYSQQTGGEHLWHNAYGCPEVGISVFAGSLGNKEELGWLSGILPHLSLNTSHKALWKLRFTLGLGMAYFNQPYDSISNPYNILIGSHFTMLAYGSVYLRKLLSRHWFMTFGLSALHASNSHVQIPNGGLNISSGLIGLGYYLSPRPDHYPLKDKNIHRKKQPWRINLRLGLGIHEQAGTLSPVGTPKYAIYVLSGYLSKRLSTISRLHIGLSVKHYNSFYQKIVQKDLFQNQQFLNASIVSILLGHECMIGRVGFCTQAGLNVFKPFYAKYDSQHATDGLFNFAESYFSTRIGLNVYLFDPATHRFNIFAGSYIKGNSGNADFWENTIGIVF